MNIRTLLACSALAVCFGFAAMPAAQAMDNGDGMSKTSDAMMHKGGMKMKKHKKHKDSMMHDDHMKSEDAPPAQ